LRTNLEAYIALFAGVASLAAAAWFYNWVLQQDAGSEKAQEVAS